MALLVLVATMQLCFTGWKYLYASAETAELCTLIARYAARIRNARPDLKFTDDRKYHFLLGNTSRFC